MRTETVAPSLAPADSFNSELGVYDETHPLRRIAVWGPPSVEAVLGQLLPPSESLFHNTFDVAAGRDEFAGLVKILKGAGVEVVEVRQMAAQRLPDLPDMPHNLRDLTGMIGEKALALRQEYGRSSESVDMIGHILVNDLHLFGDEETTVKINFATAMRKIPLSNIIYGRDQSNVLGQTIVFSRLRHPIRRPEVGLYRAALDGYNHSASCHVVGQGKSNYGEHFEGGDGIMFDGAAFVGVGIRTNQQGATGIFRAIEPHLQNRGFEFFAVVDEYQEAVAANVEGGGIEMDDMHLDTYWMPLKDKVVLTCPEVASRKTVRRVWRKNGEQDLTVENEGDLLSFMVKRGIEIYPIPIEEQRNYATNYLLLGNNMAIVPLSDNTEALKAMEKAGLTVIPAEIRELVGGYGAVHCMTAALNRG